MYHNCKTFVIQIRGSERTIEMWCIEVWTSTRRHVKVINDAIHGDFSIDGVREELLRPQR